MSKRSISPMSHSTWRRSKALYLPLAAISLILFLLWTPLPQQYHNGRHAVVQGVVDAAKPYLPKIEHTYKPIPPGEVITLENVTSKYAFATFLAGTDQHYEYNDDHYFIAIRILAYQMLHATGTKSEDSAIPFLVLVTQKVPEYQRQRLREDGAIVVAVPSITPEWVHPSIANWDEMMTKLRLWELTQFDRICFLDGDTQLLGPLDGIFSDPAVTDQTSGVEAKGIKGDEGPLPKQYVFAGTPEMNHAHHYPPSDENHDYPNINYFNAGFFVLKPSIDVLDYYISVMNIPGRFEDGMPEQNLLNYAHRRHSEGGNMPWTQLANTWNIHYPSVDDVNGGVRTIHEKWWQPPDGLRLYMESWRWRMEGFQEARDQLRAASAKGMKLSSS